MVSSVTLRFRFAVSWNLPYLTAMLITRIDGMVSYAFGRCKLSKTRAPRAYQNAPALIMRFSRSFPFMRTATHRSCQCYQEPTFRILYVGSDQELLVALRTVLLRPEYHIVSCADRSSAILFLKGDPRYDLLLFDLELHGSTGLKLARLAQSLPHRRRTPKVIATSNEITGSLEELARKAGVNECLTQTEDADELSRTIMRLLEREAAS